MDSYFFVRFLRMMVRVLLPIWLISWVILLPITAVKTEVESHSGLDKYTYGNVAPDKTTRYAAHLILAWVFTCESQFNRLVRLCTICVWVDVLDILSFGSHDRPLLTWFKLIV